MTTSRLSHLLYPPRGSYAVGVTRNCSNLSLAEKNELYATTLIKHIQALRGISSSMIQSDNDINIYSLYKNLNFVIRPRWRDKYQIGQEEIERFIIHMAKSKNAIGLFVTNIGFKDEA
ncbi:20190_t:CDS:2, partial [Cetraspora pellucida]